MIADSMESVTFAPAKRANGVIEAAVNKGLAAALLNDRAAGAKIMLDAGVPQHVVTRVLLGSHKVHRETDWK